jgi:cell wall-associated NlpC family hydrolase
MFKSFLYIAFFFIPLVADLPEANQKVIDYVDSHIGKKVKTGICFDLVDQALKQVDKKWKERNRHRYIYGTKVDSANALPGDIIEFNNVVYENGAKIISHVAILYKMNADGSLMLAEQNVGKQGDKTNKSGDFVNSKVVIETIAASPRIKGTIRYYRPY